jgi:DHA3 family macrolide efflux protein-like MFS transporter
MNIESNKSMKPFYIIFSGQAFSLFGSRLVGFALVWYLTQTTGSATVLAIATLLAMLPQVLLGPLAGALIDRGNRRWIMIGADGGIALATLLLAVLFLTGVVQVWHIYAVLLIRALGEVFHYTAMQASMGLLVPEEQLTRINGLRQMLEGLMGIVAPVAGALALQVLPMQGVLAIDILTAALAIGTLLLVSIPQPALMNTAQSSPLADMLEGFRYVWNWRGLAILLGMATLLNMLLIPAISLLPVFVKNYFGGGAVELSWAEAAMGTGIIVGALLLSVWGGFKKRIYTSFSGVITLGSLCILIAFLPTRPLWFFIAAMGILGASIAVTNGPVMAILQAVVAPEKQGRVFGLVGALSGAAAPVGLMFAGPVADALGVQTWWLIGGAYCVIAALSMLFMPAVANIEAHGQSDLVAEAVPATEQASA